MIPGYSPLVQALLGTGFGWFMTAFGAWLVYPLELFNTSPSRQKLFLDASLGAAAGIMLAASFFSLLAPAIDEAEKLWPGKDWLVASVGFLMGGGLMVLADLYLPEDLGVLIAPAPESTGAAKKRESKRKESPAPSARGRSSSRGKSSSSAASSSAFSSSSSSSSSESDSGSSTSSSKSIDSESQRKAKSWRRILLLVLAISLHNAPEGGAVGVAFGALSPESDADGLPPSSPDACSAACISEGCSTSSSGGMTFAAARSVALGIGLQNFPEGLAVSLPLRREGCSLFVAFFWGQVSGLVEVVSGFLGAYLVTYARVALPIALSGAAGAMVYVVCSELIPEAHGSGNDRAVNLGVMLGFVVMMALDVALG